MATALAVRPPDFSKDFELTTDQFHAWLEALDPADVAEFYMIYQGDDILLRFVCAIDYLFIQKVTFASPKELWTTAYWIAAHPFEDDLAPEGIGLENRAVRAWNSDAVQAVYERVRYRSVRQGNIRLQNKLFALGDTIAEMAEDPATDLEDKIKASDALVKIAKLADTHEAVIRSERTKRGLSAAREALERHSDVTERELAVLMKAARHQLGGEKFKALVENVDKQQSS